MGIGRKKSAGLNGTGRHACSFIDWPDISPTARARPACRFVTSSHTDGWISEDAGTVAHWSNERLKNLRGTFGFTAFVAVIVKLPVEFRTFVDTGVHWLRGSARVVLIETL